jgi:Mg-chelatase subunit ChlD
MRALITILFSLFYFLSPAQLGYDYNGLQLGNIAEANEIIGDIVLRNNSGKKVYLMRADAENGVKVFTSKRSLQPNDTCLIVISFYPTQEGKFNKQISLVASDAEKPYKLELTGNLQKLTQKNSTSCFYFGSKNRNNVAANTNPIVVTNTPTLRDNSNKLPDATKTVKTSTIIPEKNKRDSVAITPEINGELPELLYKPNNIIFLVDVSNSMKDSLKFPVMKKALNVLIGHLRDIDKITFLTYADTVKVINEAIAGSQKEELYKLVKELKAGGKTKGNKAILKAQQIAQKNYIVEGNNEVILCTDGKFGFYKKDQEQFLSNQNNKAIIVTTVGFGSDKEAKDNLKDIAKLGKGSFISVNGKGDFERKILDEVKLRSLK